MAEVRLRKANEQAALKEAQENIRLLEAAMAAEATRRAEERPAAPESELQPEAGATIATLQTLAAQAEGPGLAKLADAVEAIQRMLSKKTASLGGTPGTSKRGRHGVVDGDPEGMAGVSTVDDLL